MHSPYLWNCISQIGARSGHAYHSSTFLAFRATWTRGIEQVDGPIDIQGYQAPAGDKFDPHQIRNTFPLIVVMSRWAIEIESRVNEGSVSELKVVAHHDSVWAFPGLPHPNPNPWSYHTRRRLHCKQISGRISSGYNGVKSFIPTRSWRNVMASTLDSKGMWAPETLYNVHTYLASRTNQT